jgi:hypothetical protein
MFRLRVPFQALGLRLLSEELRRDELERYEEPPFELEYKVSIPPWRS